MKQIISTLSAAALLLSPAISHAQEEPEGAPSPGQIVAGASAEEWVKIAPEDLVVMTLASDAAGNERKVVIQLMPKPFSQGWVQNIRTLARAGWYDNISVNRVQDNYVVQWGDPNYDNPEAEGETKALPEGLKVMGENSYTEQFSSDMFGKIWSHRGVRRAEHEIVPVTRAPSGWTGFDDPYANAFAFAGLMPLALTLKREDRMVEIDNTITGRRDRVRKMYSLPGQVWPVHCYGMVGVGRGYSPDTGSGAELYTVIGHAPRHLDRNIALVGRIIEGMEHLSSLPRGKGVLGFYGEDELDKRTPILTVRVANDLPEAERPYFEYLSTDGETFARYVEARANRRDPFFIVPAGGADICNIPVPVRRVKAEASE